MDAAREKYGLAALAERPADGFTAREYASRYGLNLHTARGHLTRMEASGVLKRVLVMLPDNHGRVGATAVYIPVQP